MPHRSARTNWLLAAALVLVAAGTVLAALLSLPPLSDTQVVYVDTDFREETGTSGAPSTEPGAATGSTAAARVSAVVNLNTADANELATLDGIGPVIAARIIAYREEHGGFRSVDELTAIQGIGDKKLAAIRDQVTVK